MSSKYGAANTLMNDLSQSMMGRDRPDGNCRTNNTGRNQRNEFLFNSSRETSVATYSCLYKGNEHFGTQRENGGNGKTFPKVPNLEEPNTYKKCNADGIVNSEEKTPVDLKKKKISEIINKYRNQLKMMQSQFMRFSEGEKINEKENDQNYEKTNMHNQHGSNERFNDSGIELSKRNKSDEFYRETDLAAKPVFSNSKVAEESSPRVAKIWESLSDIKLMEVEDIKTEKFRRGPELNQNKFSTNSSTLRMEKNTSISVGPHFEDGALCRFKDKRAFDVNVENPEECENLSLYQKKRIHVDKEKEKQVDFKKKKILNSQTRRSTENFAEERENLEKESNIGIQKWTHENQADDPLSFRRFIYDSIAFDELKIKDKFKEIEQIEQLIRAKNLLSPVENIMEEKEQCSIKKTSENKKEIAEKDEHIVANHFKETKESNGNKEYDTTKRNFENAHNKSDRGETFLVETFKEKKKVALKDIYDNPAYTELIHERDCNGKSKDDDVNDKPCKDEGIKASVETALNRAFNAMKSVAEKGGKFVNEKIHYPNDCNNGVTDIIKNATNYTTSNTKIVEADTDKSGSAKDIEGNAGYKYSLSPIKPNFPIQGVANRIDKRQVAENHAENLRENRNIKIGKSVSRSSSSDVRKSLVRDNWRKEKKQGYVKMMHPRHIKKNSFPGEEKTKIRERSSYCGEEVLGHCYRTREFIGREDNCRNSKVRNYATVNEQYISSETNKLEEVENGKEILDSKDKILGSTKGNSWNNVNQKCSRKEKGNDIITKENMMMCNEGDNTTVVGVREEKEERTIYGREEEEPQFLFSNNFTQDRTLERTVKTVYTEEFRNNFSAEGKKVDEFHKWTFVGKEGVSSGVEKYKTDELDLTQSNMMINKYEQETKCKNNDSASKYELWKTKNRIRNATDTKEKRGTINEVRTSHVGFGRNEHRDQKYQVMNKTPFSVLNKSTDGSTIHKTQKKMDHVLSKTYDGIAVNSLHGLKGSTNGEMNIREKYETDYKLLEKLRIDLEEKNQQNQLFFSVNYSQNRNKNLRYTKFPDGLYVTYNDYSRVPKKRRSSIITDKVFEDDVNEKEEKGNVKNLSEGYMKDKKESIERIQRELEIIKRHKDGKEIEAIDEHLLRDEIEQKRRLYEENIRKNFQEKIKLRRQLLEQQKEENERQGCKASVVDAGKKTENEQSIRKEGMAERVNYESAKKRRETKIKNIFDEYSSDGSYYRQLYKNLYDDECNKKWKNYFYDVSDNIYLQDCSDNFFSNLKKTPSEDVSCTNSIDLDLISLSKIKFDEFDYNYLNKVGTKNSFEPTEKKAFSSSNSKSVTPLQRESNRTCTLKKPQVEFSDISEKGSSKCDIMMHIVTDVNRDVLNTRVEETEGNGILCKLVKRKTMEDEMNDNRNNVTECDDVLSDSALKNKEGNKMIVKEGTLSKKTEHKYNDIQEEIDHIGNKRALKEGLNKLSDNNVNNDANEINTTENIKISVKEKDTLVEKRAQSVNNASRSKKTLVSKRLLSEKSPIENARFKIDNLEKRQQKIHLEKIGNIGKIGKKEVLMKTDHAKINNKGNTKNCNVGRNVFRGDLKKQLPTDIYNENNKEKEIFHVATKENKTEANIEANEKNTMNIQEKEPVGEMFNVLKESSSTSSNKTLPKINILQNEQNYVPLDLALNFVMDDQKLRKRKKEKEKEKQKQKEKEKEKEPQTTNKKKTFTQWIMDERKKRLKNNLPIDI